MGWGCQFLGCAFDGFGGWGRSLILFSLLARGFRNVVFGINELINSQIDHRTEIDEGLHHVQPHQMYCLSSFSSWPWFDFEPAQLVHGGPQTRDTHPPKRIHRCKWLF